MHLLINDDGIWKKYIYDGLPDICYGCDHIGIILKGVATTGSILIHLGRSFMVLGLGQLMF